MDRRTFIAAAAAATAAPAFANDGPTRFTVETLGKGPDVILIPGLSSSKDIWRPTAEKLAARHRVHLIQLGGFAGAPVAGNADGLVAAGVAEELAAYIQANKLKTPAVIGHSMGGSMAAMLAARHPELVGRLMIVDMLPRLSDAFFPGVPAEQAKVQAAAIRDNMMGGPAEAYAAQQEQAIKGMILTESARAAPIAHGRTSDRGVSARSMYELLTTDLTPELPKITAPTVVMYPWHKGSPFQAPAVDGWYKAAYAGLKDAKLVRIDDAAHFIMIDQPDRFHAEVEAFLA